MLGPQSTYLGRCPEGTNKGRQFTNTLLGGVVNPELQFQFQEKGEKTKKHRKIKGLKQKKQDLARTRCYNFDVMLHANSSPRREAASPPHQDVLPSKKQLHQGPYSLQSWAAVTRCS
jgi:hypothetical protein